MTETGGFQEIQPAISGGSRPETTRAKYFDSIRERVSNLSRELVLANNLEASALTPKQSVRLGIKAMNEMLDGKDTTSALLMKNFISDSSGGATKYLKELGLRPSQLIKSPIGTIGKMFNIDSQTAQRMLEMFGIKTNQLSFQHAGNSMARAALAADLIGTNMLLAQGDSDDPEELPISAHVPSRKLSSQASHQDVQDAGKVVAKKAGTILNTGWRLTLIAGAIAMTAACATMTVLTLNPFGIGDAVLKQSVKPTLAPLPTVKPDAVQRTDIDKYNADKAEENYQNGAIILSPTDTSIRAVLRQLAYYDWDWWYIKDPQNQSIMDKVFAGKFSQDEIAKIKIDKNYFFTALDNLKNRAPENQRDGVQKIIDIYNKRKECGSTCNPQQFLIEAGSSSMLNDSSRQIEKLALKAVGRFESNLRGFANTGLPKSEILRRQGYKV